MDDMLSFPSIWVNGLRLDLSMAGYVLSIPLILGLFGSVFSKAVATISKWYWVAIFLFVLLIVAVDPYFFSYWGQKTNLGFTQFLGKENAGLASIEMKTYLTVIVFAVVYSLLFWKYAIPFLTVGKKHSWWANTLLLALCVLMIRGGIGKVPINVSSAYHSSSHLHNNTAVNAVWNFLATELERDKHKALVFFEDEIRAAAVLSNLKTRKNLELADYLSKGENPNVVLIVLESFSAKVVGFLGGNQYAATPELDEIMESGIAYTNAYAASFRSDKGLLALTTGVPSSARQTLTNFPDKLAQRPNIFKSLRSSYHSSFYYGGDLEFANIKVLFQDATDVFSQKEINGKSKNAWGVHDHEVFKLFADNFLSKSRPQFKMLFSLSSHEPFDVPEYKTLDDPFLNSISYTDSCLGVLINRLRQSEKWDNTIVLITADHGTIRPDNAPIWDPINFKIPLVLTGGLVKKDTTISNIVSQLDIPATIISYLNDTAQFTQSSIFQPANHAFYSYHDGLGLITDSCIQHYDLGRKEYLESPCTIPFEKAFFEHANQDFFK